VLLSVTLIYCETLYIAWYTFAPVVHVSKTKTERLDLVNGVFDRPALLILLTLYSHGSMLKTELRDTIIQAYRVRLHPDTIARRLSKLKDAKLVTENRGRWELTNDGTDFVERLLHTFADLWDWLGPLKAKKQKHE